MSRPDAGADGRRINPFEQMGINVIVRDYMPSDTIMAMDETDVYVVKDGQILVASWEKIKAHLVGVAPGREAT